MIGLNNTSVPSLALADLPTLVSVTKVVRSVAASALVVVTAWAASFGWPEQSLTRDSIQLLSIAVLPVAVLAMFTLGGFRPTTDLEELGAWPEPPSPASPPANATSWP